MRALLSLFFIYSDLCPLPFSPSSVYTQYRTTHPFFFIFFLYSPVLLPEEEINNHTLSTVRNQWKTNNQTDNILQPLATPYLSPLSYTLAKQRFHKKRWSPSVSIYGSFPSPLSLVVLLLVISFTRVQLHFFWLQFPTMGCRIPLNQPFTLKCSVH